jgi:hypothetical protein
LQHAWIRQRPIIPLWAFGEEWPDCVPLSMVSFQYIDCRGPHYQLALPKLVTTLQNLITPRAPTPPPPTPGEREYSSVLLRYQPLNILIVRFSPASRLHSEWEEEDAQIDDLLARLGELQAINLVRSRVSSTLELIKVLRNADAEIIHFSGDMNTNSICMSEVAASGMRETTLDIREFARYLGLTLSPAVRVLLLTSCCTLSSLGTVVPHAPYLVAVEALYPSPAPTLFVKAFYSSYVQQRGVKRAFDDACLEVDTRHMLQTVDVTTLKRERYNNEGKPLIDVVIDGLPDPLTIDLSDVMHSLTSLGVGREAFLRTLATKMRAHRALFSSPGTNVILSIGSLLHGIFSWDASAGYIRCSKLFRFKGEVDSVQWREWCRILLAYNGLSAEEYRSIPNPGDPAARTIVSQAVHRFLGKYRAIKASVDVLAQLGFNEATNLYILGEIYVESAKENLDLQDFPMVVTQLEMALTTLHDIMKTTMPAIEGEL